MDEVTLEGVVYTKAAVAAKRFRYTADYVGQLCRGKKVDARLVGRTWYVNVDSLEKHKDKKSTKSVPVSVQAETREVTEHKTDTPPVTKRRVEPVLLRKTARTIQLPRQAVMTDLQVQYSVDDGHLMPKIDTIDNPPSYLHIEPAGAKNVEVSETSHGMSFTPEQLPDVALSGKLTVSDMPDDESMKPLHHADSAGETSPYADDIASKNKAISDDKKTEKNQVSLQINHAPLPHATKPVVARAPHQVSVPEEKKRTVSVTESPARSRKITIRRPVQTTKTAPNLVQKTAVPKMDSKQTCSTVPSRPSTLSKIHPHTADATPVTKLVTANKPLTISKSPAAETVTRAQKVPATAQSEGSILSFLALLIVVIASGLLVGYLMVASSSDYTVTAAVTNSNF